MVFQYTYCIYCFMRISLIRDFIPFLKYINPCTYFRLLQPSLHGDETNEGHGIDQTTFHIFHTHQLAWQLSNKSTGLIF